MTFIIRPLKASALLGLFCGSMASAQVTDAPPSATVGQTIAADIKGIFIAPPSGTPNGKMPDGPVTGNGDLGLTMGGSPDQLRFYLGKSDFFGVRNGKVMPVGSMALGVPELKGASYHVEQAIGPASITGKFVAPGGAELSLKSWIPVSQNMLVVELTNTGSEALTLSSKLLDGISTSGNPATYQSSPNSTALRVSPDSWNMEIGNFLEHHGDQIIPRGVFQGDLAEIRIYEQALTNSSLGSLDDPTLPKPYLLWHPSETTPLIGQGKVSANGDHGATLTLGDDPAAEVPFGYVEIPEHQFTLTALVRATATAKQNIILTTYYDWIGVGVKLYLSDGRLTAALNHTSVAADDPIPLNQWTQLAATYDGTTLTLYQDGKMVGSTDKFPPTSDVLGSNRSAIHYGDKDVPYEDCAPNGLMVQRVIGANAKEDQQALNFTLEPRDQATVLVAVTTDRKNPDYLGQARQMTSLGDTASLAKLEQEHAKWWNDFWAKSSIKISDQRIQASWYGSLYLLACCSRADSPPPGLWGNFITDSNMGWQGDYTLDYNYEAPFWAALATNHLELVENYEQPLFDNLPRATHNGPEHFHHPGLAYYTHLIPAPGWDADNTDYMKQKGCTLFAQVDCVMRWRYTHDPAYAQKIYPMLKGAAEFWDNDLVLKDGFYYDADDAAAEMADGNNNTSTTLAFIRLVYPALIEISKLLNVDEDLRDKWTDVLAKLPPYPIVATESIGGFGDDKSKTLADIIGPEAQGQMVIRNAETGYAFPTPMYHVYQDRHERNSSPGMSSAQVIFPGWAIGLESSDADRKAALNTITYAAQWYDYNNECTFYPAAACTGYDPGEILKNINGLIDTQMAPNFMFRTGGGGTEDFAIVPATISAMFLQSYQTNIHVFPNWPMDQDASFENLNACGGFLISSDVAHGKITSVRVTSLASEKCHLINPWPASQVGISDGAVQPTILSGSILVFPTRPGEHFVLKPL